MFYIIQWMLLENNIVAKKKQKSNILSEKYFFHGWVQI